MVACLTYITRSQTRVGLLVSCWYKVRNKFDLKYPKQDWFQIFKIRVRTPQGARVTFSDSKSAHATAILNTNLSPTFFKFENLISDQTPETIDEFKIQQGLCLSNNIHKDHWQCSHCPAQNFEKVKYFDFM